MRALFAVLFDCGFRIGEALNLHVGQIDLTARTIRLNPGETKSGRGREAPMTSATFELIRACCAGKARQEFVFTRGDGSRVLNFRKTWTHITKAAGMPDLLVHDIRRSAVRRMIARGISQHVAMAISGHRTIHVFQRYAIISHDDLRDAARKQQNVRGSKRESVPEYPVPRFTLLNGFQLSRGYEPVECKHQPKEFRDVER